jgi:4-hydroxy-tetrahydrodipicolinate synthase
VKGFLVNGSTGECVSLSAEERQRTIEIVSSECEKKAFVIGGVEIPVTWDAINEAKRISEAGADFALVATPYYLKPTMDGVFEHYKKVAESGINILAYNNPFRTNVVLSTPLLEKLADVPNIIGMKQSNVNMSQTAEIIRLLGDTFKFIHSYGDAVSIFPGLLLGGVGAMSLTTCFVPEKILQLYEATIKRDIITAIKIYKEILPLLLYVGSGVHGEPNPAPFKEALRLIGRSAGPTRFPVTPVTKDTSDRIKKVLKDANII